LFSVRPQRDGEAGGHSTGFSRGAELAITPLVFVGLGFGLDRLLGTTPWLTLLVSVVGITGTMAKLWLGYDQDMRAQEVGKPWTRGPISTQPAVAADGPVGPATDPGRTDESPRGAQA
jgi:hypothetical protein